MLADGMDEAFQVQAMACGTLGSPLYAELLARCLENLRAGGWLADLLDDWRGHPLPDALPLRLLGAVHRLVLDGETPALAAHYPSAGGTPRWPEVWEAFVAVVAAHRPEIRRRLDEQVQTNEVSRSGALLGGFLRIAGETRLPLRLLEIGSSAGLNLLWDRYRYEQDGRHLWGSTDAPVVIPCRWHGRPAHLDAPVAVAERRGCDIAPVDITDPRQLRRLESFIWPEQTGRIAQLRAAAALGREFRPRVDRAAAAAWLPRRLAAPAPGIVTVVFHSIMWWYLGEDERAAVTACIRAAGDRATTAAPLAWLSLEIRDQTQPDLSLQRWPGGEPIRLGQAHPHGREVWWGDAQPEHSLVSDRAR
jgi:hypothetical protein